jgi:hypothetical protein
VTTIYFLERRRIVVCFDETSLPRISLVYVVWGEVGSKRGRQETKPVYRMLRIPSRRIR